MAFFFSLQRQSCLIGYYSSMNQSIMETINQNIKIKIKNQKIQKYSSPIEVLSSSKHKSAEKSQQSSATRSPPC